jgi:hypothetical protein
MKTGVFTAMSTCDVRAQTFGTFFGTVMPGSSPAFRMESMAKLRRCLINCNETETSNQNEFCHNAVVQRGYPFSKTAETSCWTGT